MNILHLSTEYNQGGSGRAAYRIHASLRRRGHTSHMLVSGLVHGAPEAGPIWGTMPWRAADWLARRATDALSLQYLFYLPPGGCCGIPGSGRRTWCSCTIPTAGT